jgi:hypothetical protein
MFLNDRHYKCMALIFRNLKGTWVSTKPEVPQLKPKLRLRSTPLEGASWAKLTVHKGEDAERGHGHSGGYSKGYPYQI